MALDRYAWHLLQAFVRSQEGERRLVGSCATYRDQPLAVAPLGSDSGTRLLSFPRIRPNSFQPRVYANPGLVSNDLYLGLRAATAGALIPPRHHESRADFRLEFGTGTATSQSRASYWFGPGWRPCALFRRFMAVRRPSEELRTGMPDTKETCRDWRSFRNGDSLRHIHWAQTAKHDRLVVCERQTTGRRRVQLIIDGHKEAHPGCDGANRLEEMIRVGALIGRQFHAHNANVDVHLGRQTVVVTAGSRGLIRLLDALAIWLPFDDPEAKTIPDVAADDRSLLVVVTTDRAAGRWSSQLLRHRGAQLVILRFGTQNDAPESRLIDERGRQSAQGEVEARPPWLELDGHDDVLVRLVHRWERLCHDGWSHC